MKRLLGLFLVCVMVMGAFGIVPVAAEGDSGYVSGDINFFSSFSDYNVGFAGYNVMPEGFINISAPTRCAAGIGRVSRGASNAVKLGPDKELVLPFNTNFLDGYMHISFDYMQTNEAETNTGRMLRVLLSRNNTVESSTKNYADLNGNITVYDTAKNVMNKYDSQGKLISKGEDSVAWNQNEFDYTKITSDDSINLMQGGSYEAGVARTLYSGNNKLVGVSDASGTVVEDYSTKEDTWYKVDMFLDRSDNRYYVYVDGVLQSYDYLGGLTAAREEDVSKVDMSSDGKRALKALILRCDHLRGYNDSAINSGNTNGYVYLDNVYVSQYTANDCKKDALKITAETKGETITTGSKMNIAFSEYLSTVPTKGDIVITDSNNTPYTDFTVVADNTQATITFNGDIPMNDTYTLTVNNVTGAASQSTVSNTVEFSTIASTSAAATNYYWANEDFNDFETGVVLPNWYYGVMNAYGNHVETKKYGMPEAANTYSTEVESTEGIDGTTAIKLVGGDGKTNSNNMFYFFPRGVASGEFKAEFDIKHANGGWTFGFVNYDDYRAAKHRFTYGKVSNINAPSVIEASTAYFQLNWKMESSILLGMARNNYNKEAGTTDSNYYNEIGYADRAFSPNLGMINSTTTAYKNSRSSVNNLKKQYVSGSNSEYITLAANTWSKVEVDVNDTTKVYTIKVTPYNADGTLDTANSKTTTWTDGDSSRYLQGIMGLRFSRNAYSDTDLTTYGAEQTGDVCIDNVKVYKTSTAYLDEDFDDYTANVVGTRTTNKLPSGWTNYDANTRGSALYYAAVNSAISGVSSYDGKNIATNPNDHSMFLYYGAPSVYKTLDRPIPAGEPFVVEFDTYSIGNATDNWTAANECTWSFLQMGKEDTQQLPGFNYSGNLVSKNGKVFVERTTYVAEGPDGTAQIINDAKIGAYTPFTDKTVEDSYARINGNSILDNVVFERTYGSMNFSYSPSGRQSVKRGFHSSYGHGVGITDVRGEWVNYKVLCEPISATETKYTITQTKADGTQATGTFTNSRDWVTHDTYGIGFALPFRSNQTSEDAKNGKMGTRFDNVKVYAATGSGNKITNVARNTVAEVKAVDNDTNKTADITAGTTIPVGTDKLEITFSEPINENLNPQLPTRNDNLPELKPNLDSGTFTNYYDTTGECYTDYTLILDNIRDVISLRKAGSQLESGTISLSEDKKTVTIALTMAENDKYTLGINQNIAFENGGYARLDESFTQVYTVTGNFPDAEPEEPTEDTEKINFTKLNATVWRGTADIEVDKAGPLVPGENVKIWTTTENTTDEDVDAFVGYAFYNEDATTHAEMLSVITTELLKIVKETERTEGIKTTIQVPADATSFKAFSWSYPNMVPYVEMIKAQVE